MAGARRAARARPPYDSEATGAEPLLESVAAEHETPARRAGHGRASLCAGDRPRRRFGGQPARRLVVTGLLDEGRSLLADFGDSGVVAPAFAAAAPPGQLSTTVMLRVQPGTAPETVVAALRPVVEEVGTVQTSEEAGAAALRQATGVADVFGYLLLVFGSIALLVGSMIILNTLVIILTQRRREIGLLRAVGASSGQVLGRQVIESMLLGILGYVLNLIFAAVERRVLAWHRGAHG